MSKEEEYSWTNPAFESLYTDNACRIYSTDDPHDDFVSVDKHMRQSHRDAKFDQTDLTVIQTNFHNLIRFRCRRSPKIIEWLADNKEALPEISNELIGASEAQWISIPGMYGGFKYALTERDGKPVLITESWIRVVGGSGEQHEITPEKVELVARGFI